MSRMQRYLERGLENQEAAIHTRTLAEREENALFLCWVYTRIKLRIVALSTLGLSSATAVVSRPLEPCVDDL
jgi:hypothetical protein